MTWRKAWLSCALLIKPLRVLEVIKWAECSCQSSKGQNTISCQAKNNSWASRLEHNERDRWEGGPLSAAQITALPGNCYKCILMAHYVRKNASLSLGVLSRTEEIIPVWPVIYLDAVSQQRQWGGGGVPRLLSLWCSLLIFCSYLNSFYRGVDEGDWH